MDKSRVRAWALIGVLALVCMVGAAPASAQQSGSGTLTGTVIDSTGGAMPGVLATATAAATGAVRTNVSDAAGLFRIAGLPPGEYTLKVELSGFKAVSVTAIQLLDD